MTSYIPKPSQALNELKPLTDAVNDFLLESTGHVLAYFNRQHLPVNRSVSTNMFRYELLRRLRDHCYILDQNNRDLVVHSLSNNGIQCQFAGWPVKIFRGTELRPPGHSQSRLRFFRQEQFYQPSMMADLFPDEPIPPRPNIVILWEFSEDHTIVNLRLVLPKDAQSGWDAVECYWFTDVPQNNAQNPVQPVSGTNATETSDRLDDSEDPEEPEIQELDIQFIEPQEQEDTDDGESSGTGSSPREPG